jgi:hypothetical protein
MDWARCRGTWEMHVRWRGRDDWLGENGREMVES